MENEFRKYYDGGLSLMEQADFQCRIIEDPKDLEESMLEAFMQECDNGHSNDSTEILLAKASYTKVARTLGLKGSVSPETKSRDRKYIRLKWVSGIAAVIALALVCTLSWIMLNPKPEAEWMEVYVPYGQNSELVLADGTKLLLNAGSRVTYPSVFTGSERRIFVEGEAFAEVARNPEMPFVVKADDMDIRVLGTTFNIKSYRNSDCVEVFLIEGKVQCDINAENCRNSITLTPGNVVQYDRISGEMNIVNAKTSNFRESKEMGALHFFNLTLGDIAEDLERHFNTEIIILNEELSKTKYFALFTNGESLDEILAKLNSDGTMKISRESGIIYISGRR